MIANGPWDYVEDYKGIVVLDANGFEVCITNKEAGIYNLILSAPDMYEALKAALQDITGPITNQGIKIRYSTLEAVQQALAKAEGR